MILKPAIPAPARQHGFNMIEVMVTLAVLSVGLLGFAALQAVGLRFNHQSYQRTQAVFQAYDIFDRIRANRTCVANGCAYDNVAIGSIPGVQNCISSGGAATCSNTQMATYDVIQWNTTNSLVLNTGRGAVCRGALDANFVCTAGVAADRTYSVAITWIENDMRMRIDVQASL